jgi:hypothetical protein
MTCNILNSETTGSRIKVRAMAWLFVEIGQPVCVIEVASSYLTVPARRLTPGMTA